MKKSPLIAKVGCALVWFAAWVVLLQHLNGCGTAI
jgi:hypothetical protein